MKNISKHVLACVVFLLLCAIALPSICFAAENANENIPTYQLSTENNDIGIEIYSTQTIINRSYNTTTKSHSGRFYLISTGATLANFKLTGTFSYDGTLCNVTLVEKSISNVEDGWRVTSTLSQVQVSPTLAKAVGLFELYNENTGNLSSSATITIYCNQNGVTSSEFNGDE